MSSAAIIDVQLLDRPVTYSAGDVPEGAGGECIFIGRTRAEIHPKHGCLLRLSYEVHRSLAERTLRELAEAAVARWGCRSVCIHHAVGEVPVGSASVMIRICCAHRAEAFEACRFLIDELKRTAPIWKREEWESGATWVNGQPVTAAIDSAKET